MRRLCDHNRLHEGYCDQQSDWFLKLTPLVHRKVLASAASFQDVWGELFWVVQDRSVHSPPFTSKANLLTKFLLSSQQTFAVCILLCVWISMLIQEMKIAKGKKSKSTKKFQSNRRTTASSRQSAANQHRVCDVICNALWVKQWILQIKQNKQQ